MTPLTWHHLPDGLELRLGHRTEFLFDPLAEWLTGPAGVGTTANAAADLVKLEARFTAIARDVQLGLGVAEIGVAAAQTMVTEADARPDHGARTDASRILAEATRHKDHVAETLDDVHTLIELVRDFVIGLDVPDGLLRHTADGWFRDPAPPTSAAVFPDQGTFIAEDPRRATTTLGRTVLGGIEQFGSTWRRDPDDQVNGLDPAAPIGTWTLGYLPATGELYAVRRSLLASQEIWVLGRFTNPTEVADVLAPAIPLMRSPNSLILAADLAHQAQRAPASRPRSNTG